MAEHFLTKTQIDLSQCLELNDELALESYPKLVETLISIGGEETAQVFAEPLLSKGNDQVAPSVSWYTDVKGNAIPYGRLDDGQQTKIDQELTRRLAPVKEALSDANIGQLIASALYVSGLNDIWSIDGSPVIINWGMLPEGNAADAETRTRHYGQTLSRFLPLAAAPPLTAEEAAGFVDPKSSATNSTSTEQDEPPVAATAVDASTPRESVPPPPPVHAPVSRDRVPLWAWLPLLLLSLLALMTLIWLLIPGNRILPESRADLNVTDDAALNAATNVNRALELRLQELQNAIDGAVCRNDGTLLMPDGRTIEGLLPPNPNDRTDVPGSVQPADRTAILPPDPDRVQVPEGGNPTATTSLLNHIEERTAIVLAPTTGGLSSGTGFFVGPDLLVTNFHVISAANANEVYVTNTALGSLRQAQVLKTLGPLETTGGDFALLRVPGVQQPAFDILDSSESLRLQSVIAAGYPSDLLQSDMNFQQLRTGDRSAVPGLAVTDGTVSAEQQLSQSARVVVHSAPISQGNSGGPLVDMCGRLIGVNTFVKVGSMRNLNFALSAPDLMRFLQNTDALPQVVTQSCMPQVQRPIAPTAETVAPETQSKSTLPKLPPLQPQSE